VDNWLTDGGKALSLMHWPRSNPLKHFFFCVIKTRLVNLDFKIQTDISIYIYIYIYRERERESIVFLSVASVQVRFLALPDFLRSSGSGTGSTQPREYN
jgi:hypothetical protein